MPPKKRDKEPEQLKSFSNDLTNDQELFLQTFEKPTQIYRYLRTRNMMSPIFLYRTLSYMKHRMSRTHKSRKTFNMSSLFDRVNRPIPDNMYRYMTLTFLGIYDKRVDSYQDPVKVETLLLNICHKRRKDVSSPSMQSSCGLSDVPINPSEDHPPSKAPTISIPTELFNSSNGHLVKSYVLLLRVHSMPAHCNGIISDNETEPAQKRRKPSNFLKPHDDVKEYGTELVVFDKLSRCLLVDGDYELLLQEVQTNIKGSPLKKNCSWEFIGEVNENHSSFEVFSSQPTVKFHLSWTTEPRNGYVDRPKPIRQHDTRNDVSNKENRPDQCGNNNNNNCSNHHNNNNNTHMNSRMNSSLSVREHRGGDHNTTVSKINSKAKNRSQVVYQFLYHNNSRQQTEAAEDLRCPWCALDCITLYALLKHLKLCHSRFTFAYVPMQQGTARIDVALNECYDGSYAGSPHDLISQPPGFAFSRNGPVRRASCSNILVCRPKRSKPSLSEFLELDENEYDGQRPYITGHNRLYHHTTTCLPIYPKEMDVDSEGENDPKWLQTKTVMMIDEFTDVNEGEKELMKMWNLHVMKHGFLGDCQIPLACSMFLEERGKEILMKNLYRNFVLHTCNLFDFGLISPVTLYTILQKLQDMVSESGGAPDVLQQSWEAQRAQWIAKGEAKSDTRPSDAATRRSRVNKAQGQIAQSIVDGLRRKSSGVDRQSLSTQNIADAIAQRRKSTSSVSLSGGVGPVAIKGQSSIPVVNLANDKVVIQNRRKSLTLHNQSPSVSSSTSNGNDSALQLRKTTSNQQSNSTSTNQNRNDNPSPLRRKSLGILNSNSDIRSQSLNSTQQSVTPSVDGNPITHRRKSACLVDSVHSAKNGGC